MAPATSSSLSLTGFFVWWGQELAGLLPSNKFRSALNSPPRHIVSINKDGFRLLDQRAPRAPAHDNPAEPIRDSAALIASLKRLTNNAAATTIGLRLPSTSCFIRQVELPRANPAQTAQMLALDLERNSPFKSGEIWTAHVIQTDVAQSEPIKSGKQLIQQLIVKRAETSAIIASLAAHNVAVVWLDCWDAQGSAPLPVNFLSAQFAPPPPTPRAKAQLIALAATALLLAASAVYLWIEQHNAALSTLKAQTASLKAKAQAERVAQAKSKTQFNEFAALQQLQDDYSSKTQMLNELTALLPDTVWVTDLKLEGANLELTGFAQSAADVVRTLERSTTFSDVQPASAITFDQRANRERFSLRLRLRGMPDGATAQPKETPE